MDKIYILVEVDNRDNTTENIGVYINEHDADNAAHELDECAGGSHWTWYIEEHDVQQTY